MECVKALHIRQTIKRRNRNDKNEMWDVVHERNCDLYGVWSCSVWKRNTDSNWSKPICQKVLTSQCTYNLIKLNEQPFYINQVQIFPLPKPRKRSWKNSMVILKKLKSTWRTLKSTFLWDIRIRKWEMKRWLLTPDLSYPDDTSTPGSCPKTEQSTSQETTLTTLQSTSTIINYITILLPTTS